MANALSAERGALMRRATGWPTGLHERYFRRAEQIASLDERYEPFVRELQRLARVSVPGDSRAGGAAPAQSNPRLISRSAEQAIRLRAG